MPCLKIINASRIYIHQCQNMKRKLYSCNANIYFINTLRTGDADLRFYITTVQDG